ncbi:MAG TPA: tetratricopeptide repeat protein [Phycisphaerae bacterium]|nr:tetratricopeptide repeat protein [Phycisphaerae bacterium]
MSDQPSTNSTDGAANFSEPDIARARKWFEKGQELAGKKNYDYAIESYITGLSFWPEAVDEGHKPCRAAALFRGPQKVSFTDGLKLKAGSKDPKQAMLNAEAMLAKAPGNIQYMEAVFKNAARARFDQTAMWIGEILADAADREGKPSLDRYAMMRKVYEEIGDRLQKTDPTLAIKAYERAVRALDRMRSLKPQDMTISTDLRDVSGKLTILKGQYDTADSFRDSVRDSEGQRALQDKDRVVQSDARMEELIEAAAKRLETDPADRNQINELVTLLCKRENEKDEIKAIDVLIESYKVSGDYRFKIRADDIRMAQLRRQALQLRNRGNREAVQKHLREQLRFELGVYQERNEQYPTDLRLKYEVGIRLFKAGRYDDAIPMLQEARNDPKIRGRCNLYIGRCFFEKGYHAQAVDTLKEAIRTHEPPDDDLGKDLNFRLGMACQAAGQKDDALKIYGQIIQWDYNYRNGEVRKRIDDLKNQGDGSDARPGHP